MLQNSLKGNQKKNFLMFKIGVIFCYSLDDLFGGKHNSEASNLSIVKNTHGEVLILVKLQTAACNFTKINTPPCRKLIKHNLSNLLNILHCPVTFQAKKD